MFSNCSENDNEGRFNRQEIELRFRENVLNGYKIPFEGAKDIDEGENNEMDYVTECVNERNCLSLFELIIVSRSSSLFQYDQLALKFSPSTSMKNEYQLRISTKNKSPVKYSPKVNENILNVKIQIEEKEKETKFSQSIYEFLVLFNSSSMMKKKKSLIKFGRVHAIGGKSLERIYYQLISTKNNQIEINSLTGELFLDENSKIWRNESELTFDVQASILKENSSKLFYEKCQVRLTLRQLDLLDNSSFHFDISSLDHNRIVQLNQSMGFLIDENLPINQTLFHISIQSFSYPTDRYILSLNNYLHQFTLLSSTKKKKRNEYSLQIKQKLHSPSIFLLNMSVKHQLTQHFLSNLVVELIVVNQWTTTTSEIIRKKTNQSMEFCRMNEKYLLYSLAINTKKKRIGILNVVKSNSTMKIREEEFVGEIINETKVKINDCELMFDEKKEFNQSLKYQLCSVVHWNICLNFSFSHQSIDNVDEEKIFLSTKQMELFIWIISMIFVFITIILLVFICRLKEIDLCSTILDKCFVLHRKTDQENYSLSSFSSTKIEVRSFFSSQVND